MVLRRCYVLSKQFVVGQLCIAFEHHDAAAHKAVLFEHMLHALVFGIRIDADAGNPSFTAEIADGIIAPASTSMARTMHRPIISPCSSHIIAKTISVSAAKSFLHFSRHSGQISPHPQINICTAESAV